MCSEKTTRRFILSFHGSTGCETELRHLDVLQEPLLPDHFQIMMTPLRESVQNQRHEDWLCLSILAYLYNEENAHFSFNTVAILAPQPQGPMSLAGQCFLGSNHPGFLVRPDFGISKTGNHIFPPRPGCPVTWLSRRVDSLSGAWPILCRQTGLLKYEYPATIPGYLLPSFNEA